MENFQVIQPSLLLRPYIKQYWFLSMDNIIHGSQRLLPFGSILLIFHRSSQSDSSENGSSPVSCLIGQSLSYKRIEYSGFVDFIAVVFRPQGAKAVFGFPINEFGDDVIPIDALSDIDITNLNQRLLDIDDNHKSVELIEEFFLQRISRFEGYNYRRIQSVIDAVNSGQNEISSLARTACLGYKQFKRIFTEYIGTNPKDFIRVSRFQQASHLLQIYPKVTLSELADICGYYDKSHLIAEFKQFSGCVPSEYLSLCSPYSDYHSLFRSAFLDSPNS